MSNIKTFREIENALKDIAFPYDFSYDFKSQLKDYVYTLSHKALIKGDTERKAVTDIYELQKRKEYIRKSFIESMGGLPDPSDDLTAKITGTVQFDGYKVEKIIYSPRNNVYVTTNMYIPDNIEVNGENAAILLLCGHSDTGKSGIGSQRIAQGLVHAGLIVFVQDPIGQGERHEYMINTERPEYTCCWEHDYAGYQCSPLGNHIYRYFVHDSIRALDYLQTRPEIDPMKIGVTGYSGGGMQTAMLMLVDDRPAAVALSNFITSRMYYMNTGQAMDREQIWSGLTERGIDHEDIILSMVPKPVMIICTTSDYFPIEGTLKTYNNCKRFWKFHNKSDNLVFCSDDAYHAYTENNIRKAAAFFLKHLTDRIIDCKTYIEPGVISPLPIDDVRLHCTPTGQVLTSIGGACTIYDQNNTELQRITDMLSEKSKTGKNMKDRALEFLQDCIGKNRTPVQGYFLKRWYEEAHIENGLRADGFLWLALECMANTGIMFTCKENERMKIPVTIAMWDGGIYCLSDHSNFIYETCRKGRAVFVYDVIGNGKTTPHALSWGMVDGFYGSIAKLNDDLIWLNDSLAALRTHNLIRLVDVISNHEYFDVDDGIEIYTHGNYNVYADIAKFIDGDKKIKSVVSDKPFIGFKDFVGKRIYNSNDIASVILPGILNYIDLNEMRG